MRVDGTISYEGVDPARVFAMLIDPEFQREKCAATGATSYDVKISEDGPRTVIVCRRMLPTDGLPDFVKPFVASGLELLETISWAPPDADGIRLATVDLEFTGQPLSMTGELTMVGSPEGTSATLVAQLTASVPLVGARIEKACEPMVEKGLRTEQEVGTAWLAARR